MDVKDESGANLAEYKVGELPWNDNKQDISCIPEGTYTVEWVNETKKHPTGVYVIQNVPDRTACEIHIGNYCGDIRFGYYSDVDGCILLGLGFGVGAHEPKNGLRYPNQAIVTESTEAINEFQQLMEKQPFTLTIVEKQPLSAQS